MKDKITILFYNTLRFLLKKLPTGFSRVFGSLIGFLAYLITPKRRKRARYNLEKALELENKKSLKLIKKVYHNLGYVLGEFLIEDQLKEAEIDQIVEFKGLNYLDQTLAEKKGVILYTAHLGNWELLGTALAQKGYQIDAIARAQNNSVFDQKINEIRKASGVGIIPKGLAVRQVFKSLKNNRITAFLGDQDARSSGWKLKFFARDASTYPGAVQFAKRTGAPILPAFIHRRGWLKHEIKFYPPHWIDSKADREELESELQSLLKITEAEIRENPADWMWLHKRWKTYN